ncbi:hypothetical protein [Candidatus Tisiphia endosymbiont of Micropterix aruncella]|uniref:hypothetical protein n=1 Tax=Candidatus Tisiphia endosymbiont of Micropterix aruncella TaxID=3066271 RepID=UPI003AA91C62
MFLLSTEFCCDGFLSLDLFLCSFIIALVTLTTKDGSIPPSRQVSLKDSLPPKIHDFASCSSFFAVRNFDILVASIIA